MIARYESFSLLENDLFHTHMNWLSKVQNCTNDQCILPPPLHDPPSFPKFYSFYPLNSSFTLYTSFFVLILINYPQYLSPLFLNHILILFIYSLSFLKLSLLTSFILKICSTPHIKKDPPPPILFPKSLLPHAYNSPPSFSSFQPNPVIVEPKTCHLHLYICRDGHHFLVVFNI